MASDSQPAFLLSIIQLDETAEAGMHTVGWLPEDEVLPGILRLKRALEEVLQLDISNW